MRWFNRKKLLFVAAVLSFFLILVRICLREVDQGHVVTSQCTYTSLRPENSSSDVYQGEDVVCRIHKPHPASCREANKDFGNPTDDLGTRQCLSSPTSDICWFTETQTSKLICSLDFCDDSTIYMARTDTKYGSVREWEAIPAFTTEKALKFVHQSIEQGETFCFIKCAGIVRVIIFPPKIILRENLHKNNIELRKNNIDLPENGINLRKTNINIRKNDINVRRNDINVVIVLLDSFSRSHFYRVLRKSIGAFREISNDESVPATVLDFELFQSISMHTFENLRPLFSGVIQGDTNFNKKSAAAQEPLGVDVLFKHYKNEGYQTLMQEDLCWYDEWGIVLDNLERKPESMPTPERWARFQEVVRKHQLDHVGLSHFSCEVFKSYGITNHYDRPQQVCFNGRFFSSYFYNYIKAYIKGVRDTKRAKPIVLYQHLNTGHTSTGTRIQNMDEELASFIHFMARDPNTWTVILSDHGHTRTTYGLTEEGLLERYNPFLFMIIPKNVAAYLGKETMDNLATNQRRLLTTLDVHKALMTFHQESNKRSKDFRTSGVFSKIPSNRTCMELSLMPLARCQCDGSEDRLKDNSPSHTWLAEFALGTLNNFIQKQFTEGERSKSLGMNGFGRCMRMRGKSFHSVLQSKSGSQVTFNIHVDGSSVGLQEDEVFRVAVNVTEGIPSLMFYDRQTLYNKFKDCVDESVELKLCLCDKRKTINKAVHRVDGNKIRTVAAVPMFGSKTNVTDLHEGCLLQVTRSHPSGISLVYEVVNSCRDKTFRIEVKGSSYYVFLSRKLPMVFEVEPNTFHFMFSGARQILNFSHLDIKLTVTEIS